MGGPDEGPNRPLTYLPLVTVSAKARAWSAESMPAGPAAHMILGLLVTRESGVERSVRCCAVRSDLPLQVTNLA